MLYSSCINEDDDDDHDDGVCGCVRVRASVRACVRAVSLFLVRVLAYCNVMF